MPIKKLKEKLEVHKFLFKQKASENAHDLTN